MSFPGRSRNDDEATRIPDSGLYEALAHETRRGVLKLLKDRERMSAGAIAEALDVARPTLSGHLNILKAAHLVVSEREGTTIWYRVNLTVLEELVSRVVDLFDSARHRRLAALVPVGENGGSENGPRTEGGMPV